MVAIRRVCLAGVCLFLVGVGGCNRKVDTGDFLPSAPAAQGAVTISVAQATVPADGASTVRVTAQISPDADPDKRTVRFHTSLGTWVEPGSTTDKGVEFDRQADAQGKAEAFLKSALEPGVALVTISVITTAADDSDVVLATVSGEVEFTQVEDALTLEVTSNGEAVADGVTPVVLEAMISAKSPPSWNKVEFTTDFGAFLGAATATPQSKTVETDDSRVARVQLTSLNVGTATVTAKIMGFDYAVTELVDFSARNDEAIQLEVPASVAADGESQASVTALLAPRLAGKEVAFTTSAGTFASSTGTSATASADADGRATVRLIANKTIQNDVLVRATIDLGGGTKQSAEKTIDFLRPFPDVIQLSPELPVAGTDNDFTAVLFREIGDLLENTPVDFTVRRSGAGGSLGGIEFVTTPVLSAANSAGAQEVTATLSWAGTTETLPLVVIVTASSGTAKEEVSITLP